jgi:hypothetical protein
MGKICTVAIHKGGTGKTTVSAHLAFLAAEQGSRTLLPKLAAEWDRRKNGELTPANVTFGFTGTVWWCCPAARDHTWQARVNIRVRWPRCPFCTGRRVSVTNSLAKLFPKVAREWSSARNRELTPADVLAASKDLVWWRCPLGHEWRASVCDRTAGGKACPLCADASIHRAPRRS